MTARLRTLVAAAPLLAAALLTLGSRCTDAAHSLLLYLGVVHTDAGCASGMALGPSASQLAGASALALVAALAGSAAVREAIDSLVDGLDLRVGPVLLPLPAPVNAGYRRRLTWGVRRGSGSRDPPRGSAAPSDQ